MLDLHQKIVIINEIEVGKNRQQLQKRKKLRQAFESCASNRHKRLYTPAFDDVEEALLKWFSVVHA